MMAQKRTTKNNMPIIREMEFSFLVKPMLGLDAIQPNSKVYKMGICKIIVSPPTDGMGWHLSIGSKKRYPTWDEIAHARYELLPDDCLMMMELPPMDEYVNIHENTFHLHENVSFEQTQSILKVLTLFDGMIARWIAGDQSALDKLRELHSDFGLEYHYNEVGELIDKDGNLYDKT